MKTLRILDKNVEVSETKEEHICFSCKKKIPVGSSTSFDRYTDGKDFGSAYFHTTCEHL